MRFETKYKILLWKGYYDKGFSITSTFKYIFYFLGISFGILEDTQFIHYLSYAGIVYLVGCVPLGYLWYRYNWIEAEQEVNNRYNLFQKDVRKTLNIKTIRK